MKKCYNLNKIGIICMQFGRWIHSQYTNITNYINDYCEMSIWAELLKETQQDK